MTDRRFARVWRVAAVFGTGAALLGCEGGQTGSEYTGGPTGGDLPCDLHRQDLGSDEVSPLGFSVVDVVATIAGPRSATFSWQSLTPELEVTPTGTSSVELELTSDPTTGRFISFTPPATGLPANVSCPINDVEFDAELRITTADGGLNETRHVLVRATDAASALVVVDLPWALIQGTFAVVPPAGIVAEAASLVIYIDAGGIRGKLTGITHREGKPTSTVRVVDYACWPADSSACAGQ